jgi:hypothetical protein
MQDALDILNITQYETLNEREINACINLPRLNNHQVQTNMGAPLLCGYHTPQIKAPAWHSLEMTNCREKERICRNRRLTNMGTIQNNSSKLFFRSFDSNPINDIYM